MNTKFTNRFKRAISGIMAAGMAISLIPTVSFAAQSNEYTDPADVWLESNSRTNEFDINATVTYENFFCPVCDMVTTSMVYRVPEYTKSSETALNRNVQWSDGTCIDGVSQGNTDSGTPGIDAYYSGYHYTKSVCQHCGTLNSVDGEGSYSFNKDVYGLNPCDHNFFLDFDNTTYIPYNSKYHTTTLKAGEYCQFCKGTYARATEKQETHNFNETVNSELGNQRFHVTADCDDCGYNKNEYVAAKSVIQSYYGKVDGKTHTVTVSDLSESGVHTKIRYGTEADNCNKTSAPNYTEEGYYPVYYEIDYSYGGESMTENGVSYVWLLADNSNNAAVNGIHTHDYRYLETVRPTCTELGYDRFQCNECGALQKTNYVPSNGHDYSSIVIREASCQQGGLELHSCKNCGSYYTENTSMTGHRYETNAVAATCTKNGYSEHKCIDCGKEYIGDEKESIEHHYTSIVAAPNCTEMGYSTYICDDCRYSYVADYIDALGHDYIETITAPTCTEIGYSTFNCSHCDANYIGNETAKLPHNYDKSVTKPTCTEMGYTVFNCKDCDDTYTGDYTDAAGHKYKETVTAATCTELGYTTFTCEICGHSYKGNETAKAEHSYNSVVTEPTCTELGFTTITCENCGETHKINYIEATGHKLSDWVIDEAATIENSGSKHIECTVCGENLKTAEIPQLTDKDNSDEDGHSKVGDYSILITDKNNKPIFNSEISIDKNDNITIKLPDGRLLSVEDITTITVTDSRTQQPAKDINIFIADTANNAATGKTDANGQLSVPNNQSSTGDSNGTVADKENTYVVIATNKNGELIPNCNVTVGENYSIDVKLPAGTAFNKDNRITVTVVTEKGEPVKNLRVQLIGDSDYIENGYTNIKGQLTLPMSNTDITDDKGNGEVADKDGDKVYDYIVTVSDETGLIKDALITLIAKDNSILVCLPEGKVIDYFNRTTVKVARSDGTPVKDWKVSVYNKDGSGLRTEVTDENGIVIVPPLSEAPIAKPTATPNPDIEATPLPGVDTTPQPDNKDKPNVTENPTETASPNPTEKPDSTETPNTTDKPSDATSTPTETPAPTQTPDMGDGAVVQNKNYKYRVFVWDNDGAITEFGLVKLQDNGNLEIELPTNKILTVDNRVNIRVINENDGSPIKGITVNVTDSTGAAASDITNSNGIAIVPVSDTDITDANGNAQVKDDKGNLYNVNVATETKGNIEGAVVQITDGKIIVTLPDGTVIDYSDRTTVTVTDRDNKPVVNMPVNVKDNNGGDRIENTDENGKAVVPPLSENYTDKNGNAVVNGYTVVVEDTKAKIENAFVEIKDGKISVKLPDTNELTTSNQTTVTVTDKDAKPVKDMSVTVTDKNSKTATKSTDVNGKITVPVKTSGGGSSGSGGGSSISYAYNVKVVDKDGKTVNVSKSIKDDKITLTLPNGTVLDGKNYYTITVTDRNGKVKPDINVTLKDKGNFANGVTDKNGQLILPATEHKAYVIGYDDGEFKPEGNMTRAEAAAIFARNIAERKGEKISNAKSSFTDVDAKLWYNQYIAYLEKYNIIEGYDDGTFRPDEQITRAEFVTMCTRFYNLFDKTTDAKSNKFTDVANSHWAYRFINSATAMEWIKGYADGTFKPDNNITRAEVVAIVNRVTDREADTEYVNKNLSSLNHFADLTDKGYWAWADIMEAANTHMAVNSADGETWVK